MLTKCILVIFLFNCVAQDVDIVTNDVMTEIYQTGDFCHHARCDHKILSIGGKYYV